MALIPRKRMSSDLLDPKPKKGSYNGVTSDGIFNATGEAIDNILDDGSASETVVVAVPVSQSSDYTVGNYYEVQGKIAKLRTKTDGDDATQLTFDTTSGLLDAMNDVVGDIASIGSPLQWKGPATVAQLNAGIAGINPGWTYTLTDAGTLTDGSIVVDVGDEVAWTEDDEWFKIGGDSGKIELFDVRYNQQTSDYVWPTYADIYAVVTAGKLAALKVTNPAGYVEYYWLTERPIGSGNSYTFYGGEENSKYVRIYFSGIAPKVGVNIKNTDQRAIAPMYSTTSTYAVNDAVMHDGLRYVCNTAITQAEDWNSGHWTQKSVEEEIGNVESLLAAL